MKIFKLKLVTLLYTSQAACQAVVCGTMWLQAACKLLDYRTSLRGDVGVLLVVL